MKSFRLWAALGLSLLLSACSAPKLDLATGTDPNLIERAQAGDPYAMGVLGANYRRGEGLVRDYEKARLWLERSAAKENPIGLYNLAILHKEGTGLPPNPAKAQELILRSLPGLQA